MPTGQDNVQLTDVAEPPRFSLQDNVCVCTVAPSVQLPDSCPPEIAALPVAVTLCAKPLNGAVGGVQVSVVVAAAPPPEPAVATDGVMLKAPVLPATEPPVAVTVVPVAGA